MTNIDYKTIESQCIEWSKENLNKNFEFRQYQLEHIVNILLNVLNDNKKTNVLEAPTGSGKSFIAIIACGVLDYYYDKKSYILVSDLGLMEQYIKDFKTYKLPWGIIKGHDNYTCIKNDMTFNMSECKLNMIPYSILMNYGLSVKSGYPCSAQCEYIIARKKAIEAPVTLMTYQFFLIQRNYVSSRVESEEDEAFKKRDFIVCDEAHKLTDIVQSHFSPVIDDTSVSKIDTLLGWANDNGIVPSAETMASYKFKDKTWPTVFDFTKVSDLIKTLDDTEHLAYALNIYLRMFNYLLDINEEIRSLAKEMGPESKKQLKKYLYLGDWAREVHCKLFDYCTLISDVGHKYLIKNPSIDKTIFNCIYEDKMIQKYFHKQCGNELLMSATIGNPDIYKKMIGAEDYSFEKIPSTFDFSKSPIMFLNKYRMSYKEKDANMQTVCEIIDKICKDNNGINGIIQTGSYDFTNKLYKALSSETKRRILFYTDSKEKGDIIKKFMESSNKILIGPTLLEGLNFPDDHCRFMICMKLPYASLGDKLVSAKLNYLPGWYEADVCSKLEQGFGRGIRHKTDWCKTYIVDACFGDVLNRCRENLSNESIKRIEIIDKI